ncbi:HalOD1 output domain-containing protein [Natronorubrum sp. FCH18a]|uniref:HalOD1 output domain-containing protein n=1 Tax=Natronorubrum sp. FCH18a TaxID=3447018 RepID=UPI003F51394A
MDWWNRCLTALADGGDAFNTEYQNESPVEAIARAISAIEGCAIENIPTLHNYVEPESLNRLLEHADDRDQDVTVQITVEEYEVSVDSNGTISIRDCESNANSSDSE